MAFLEAFDALEIKAQHRRTASRVLKREAIKKGYNNQLSLYGAVYDKNNDKFSARRIEVLNDSEWCKETIRAVADGFNEYLPRNVYTIWLFNSKTLKLKLLGAYD